MEPQSLEPIRQKNACILCPFVETHKIFTQDDLRKFGSSVASDRLQTRPMIKALIRLKYNISIVSLNKNFQLSDLKNLEKYDLCVITKMRAHNLIDDEDQFSQFHTCCTLWLKRNGSKIITIYSDHIARHDSPNGELYKNILYLSDHVITPSNKLKTLAKSACKTPIHHSVIEDPSILKRTAFKPIQPGSPIRIIWFGNPPNLKYLAIILQKLMTKSNSSYSYELKILTSDIGIKEFDKLLKLFEIPFHWNIKYVLWDPNNQPFQLEKELSNANISLLPSDPRDPKKNGVSHNRLVDSIQSGCIALASPIESYKELSRACLIGDDFSSLLDFSIKHNKRLCAKYSKLRPEILERFDPKLNIKKWENALVLT